MKGRATRIARAAREDARPSVVPSPPQVSPKHTSRADAEQHDKDNPDAATVEPGGQAVAGGSEG
eukprot:15445903-Alexandrium_andersonii.AAC.1